MGAPIGHYDAVDDSPDQPAGGALTGYLRRAFRESPRGLGVFLAGVGICAFGALVGEFDALVTGLATAMIALVLGIVTALLERRADERAGQAFSMARPRAEEGPTTTASEQLHELSARRQRIEAEMDALPKEGNP